MRQSANPSTAGLLLIATGVVIAGFVGVTMIAQRQARAIDQYAGDIATGIAPRIDDLTAARGELHRASVAIRGAISSADGNEERKSLDDAARGLDRSLQAYGSSPTTPGELSLRREVADAAAAYLRLGDRILSDLAAGNTESARLHAGRLGASFDEADAALQRLVRMNADQARRAGELIKNARHRSAVLSYTLHGLAASLALLLMIVVARATHAASRAANERLQLENERKHLAEDRATELEQFAARIAHDLKNPLAAVVLHLELAANHSGDPQGVAQRITRARGGVTRSLEIIDGILALARAGGRPDPEAHASLRNVIETILAELSPDAERVGARLIVSPLEDLEVACTPGALLSVVGNLLRNAVKYIGHSASNQRRIELRMMRRSDRARVEIEDNGPGIPSGSEERIFEPYVRARHFGEPGLGLGLATVRRIVDAHGGEVGVRSTEGQGSCFWFELPLFQSELPIGLTH